MFSLNGSYRYWLYSKLKSFNGLSGIVTNVMCKLPLVASLRSSFDSVPEQCRGSVFASGSEGFRPYTRFGTSDFVNR